MSSRYVQHPMEQNFADYQNRKRREGMEKALKDSLLIADCGCRFESADSSAVILCAKCSLLPCHNKTP